MLGESRENPVKFSTFFFRLSLFAASSMDRTSTCGHASAAVDQRLENLSPFICFSAAVAAAAADGASPVAAVATELASAPLTAPFVALWAPVASSASASAAATASAGTTAAATDDFSWRELDGFQRAQRMIGMTLLATNGQATSRMSWFRLVPASKSSTSC